jgi:hypothetical protein
MPRIRSEAEESAARIISCPASINSRTAFWSTDPPKPAVQQRLPLENNNPQSNYSITKKEEYIGHSKKLAAIGTSNIPFF